VVDLVLDSRDGCKGAGNRGSLLAGQVQQVVQEDPFAGEFALEVVWQGGLPVGVDVGNDGAERELGEAAFSLLDTAQEFTELGQIRLLRCGASQFVEEDDGLVEQFVIRLVALRLLGALALADLIDGEVRTEDQGGEADDGCPCPRAGKLGGTASQYQASAWE
jgi:hypothetical protein